MIVTRFAPSPTGRLHLGHAFSAIRAHDFARERGGCFLLRIEDIDGTRSRPEHVATILADLAWLGLAWDGEVVFQSQRLALYQAALDRLKAMGLLYPCFCTRADIAASASAPHGPEGAVYPGTCRGLDAPDLTRPHCWRLDMTKALQFLPHRGRGTTRSVVEGRRGAAPPSATAAPPSSLRDATSPEGADLAFHDSIRGVILADPASHGDVVLARKDAPASYHLAVTIDDAAQGVTDIVRGEDLFAATHVHRLLQALLDLPVPRYHHHALLTGPDGERLAKRHGAPTLAALREGGEDGRALADALRLGELPVGFAAAKA
ncbi:tRNA glutamyl-Q(34) synthetase GluQRS [Sphingomonas sp. BT-65]|uniref:tRNA glutamyl-Q(34) synthetase GluQRS n=1 Tax=Sphingomonas sp. BT-65 TaxID=2989821 RepID=UPI002236BD55|nr:tRNA glutamyl-Q(34) synthetase GluQRS [Sphingomonas sp. BT-65]MCW4461943.1 tRNA glutamyl-Q(34) synthetase GluQRS [Sphingomonas sp. BT-65]